MSENGQMKRTKFNKADLARLQNLSTLTNRLALAKNLGLSHGGERDIYNTLGYPLQLKAHDLMSQWRRQDIARAVVDRPVKATWQGEVFVTEPTDEKETELEKAYKKLDEQLDLKSKLMRVDKLAQLGEYAVLLLGFDDSAKETWGQAVQDGDRDLLYVRPISRENAEVATLENDASHPRFGLPRTYKIDLEEPESASSKNQTKTKTLTVHHSRVLHVAFELLENEIEGEPIMKAAYNRLKDLEKLIGGSAEMFWRGARPGYFGSAKEDYRIGTDVEEELQDQLDEYEHDLRRFLLAEGVEVKELTQQISDPKGHVQVQLQMLSALTGMPLRILVGSERGEMASTQDQANFKEFIQTRRTEEAETIILRPFVDTMIQRGVLPEATDPEGYSVVWSDLFTLGEKEKADVGQSRADALSKYVGQPVTEQVVPLEAFLRFFLRMDEDQVKQILELREAELEEMLAEEAELEEELEQESQSDTDEPE